MNFYRQIFPHKNVDENENFPLRYQGLNSSKNKHVFFVFRYGYDTFGGWVVEAMIFCDFPV